MKPENLGSSTLSAASGEDPPSGVVEVRNRRRVLIVEDDRDAAEVLAESLQLAGHEALIALDAQEAMKLVLGFTPEVLLLDLGLEHADGCELAVALKAMPDLRGCRLIACTGFTDALTRQRCVESGFDHHLPKPVDMNLLLQMIAGAA